MTLLFIVAVISVVVIVAVATWFVVRDPGISVTSNGAIRDERNPDNYPKY